MTSPNQHTPGPWGCVSTSNHAHDYRLTKANGMPLPLAAEAAFENGNDHREQRANARLIAAAPDLLEALRECADALTIIFSATEHGEPYLATNLTKIFGETLSRAYTAYEKATGAKA